LAYKGWFKLTVTALPGEQQYWLSGGAKRNETYSLLTITRVLFFPGGDYLGRLCFRYKNIMTLNKRKTASRTFRMIKTGYWDLFFQKT